MRIIQIMVLFVFAVVAMGGPIPVTATFGNSNGAQWHGRYVGPVTMTIAGPSGNILTDLVFCYDLDHTVSNNQKWNGFLVPVEDYSLTEETLLNRAAWLGEGVFGAPGNNYGPTQWAIWSLFSHSAVSQVNGWSQPSDKWAVNVQIASSLGMSPYPGNQWFTLVKSFNENDPTPSNPQAFLVRTASEVPEPATYLMMAAGLVGLGILRKKMV
jgi:hypothetical protein